MCDRVLAAWHNYNHTTKSTLIVKHFHGWWVGKNRNCLQCNRFGEPDETATRNFLSGKLESGCTFWLTLTPTSNKQYRVKNSTAIRDKFSYAPDWNFPVIILDVNCEHVGTCVPRRGNRIAVSKRADAYIDTMPIMAIYLLCNYMQHGVKLTSSLIKSVLQPLWTKHKGITKYDVFNLRVEIMRLMPTYSKTNADYEDA